MPNMDDVEKEETYERQLKSLIEDGEEDGNGSDRHEFNGTSSYNEQMLDVLGSDGEDEDVQGYDIEPQFSKIHDEPTVPNGHSNHHSTAPVLQDQTGEMTIDDEISKRKVMNGETSYATEDVSSVSSFSMRAQRPWHFPAPRRLRMLRGDDGSTSIDSSSQLASPSIHSSSDEGKRLPGVAIMPYGDPEQNVASSLMQNGLYKPITRSGKSQSFLRVSRLCILNDKEGNPTVMAVASGQIAVGTKQGKVGLFDRSRGWTGAISVEGSVTALAISSDKTYLAVGTSTGHIYLYEMSKLHAPSRHVAPVSAQAITAGRGEGHLQNSRIVQISFVGTRHTAIVSADEHGLSFYHSLGKILGVSSNDTLRILGRYPDVFEGGENPKKSTTLAMAALPLGLKEHQSDAHSFVALLTPSKLIIVGLKPNARTWYRRLSPDRNEEDIAISGCLSWLPSTSVSTISSATSPNGLVQPALAFSFGRYMYLLRLIGQGQDVVIREWKSYTHGVSIEAMQWLSHEYLVLYADKMMYLYDVRKGACTEQQPIMPPVSNHWLPVRLAGRETLPSLHGSFRAHKGQLFILTSNEIVTGSLISWADKLLNHVSHGDSLAAIELATQYLRDPESNGSRIGLPEHFENQKPIIASRLVELMRASTAYAFSEDRMKNDIAHSAQGVDRTPLFEGLARVCADACLALQNFSFLFDELYDAYSDAGIEGIFADQMENFIVQGQIRTLPIPVVQRLVSFRKRQERYDLAERIIRNVDPECLDLDQAINLCLEHQMYDALIYVYTHALHDFVGPIVELIPLAKQNDGEAYRIFSYLSVILIGRSYPDSQVLLNDAEARSARSALYAFVFSGRCILWPEGPGGKLILTLDDDVDEPTYPYLRLFLQFDAEAFLDALDVAFEDPWLDDDEHWSRQKIMTTLYNLEIHIAGITTFIAIFIARNAPKYPQFIHLTSTQVEKLIYTLCESSFGEDAERMEDEVITQTDRQFAVECLLSAYKPPQTEEMLKTFEAAGFYDILRRAYRSEGKWDKLAEMIVQQPDEMTFDNLNEVLGKGSKYDARTASIILQALPKLVDINAEKSAVLVQRRLSNRVSEAILILDRSPHRQLAFLDVLMNDDKMTGKIGLTIRSQYIGLLCSIGPQKVIRCLDSHGRDFFDLDYVMEVARDEGVLDALLWAQDRAGKIDEGISDLGKALAECALVLRSDTDEHDESSNNELILAQEQIQNVVHMAVRICTEHSQEELWVRVLKLLIQFTHEVQAKENSMVFARSLLQDSLSAFVSSTSAEDVSFSTLFRRLVPGSNSTYAEAKDISDAMIEAYRVRQELLGITNRLFDRDVFTAMQRLTRQRRRGWRPMSTGILCPGCGKPCIGENRQSMNSFKEEGEVSKSFVSSSPLLNRRISEVNQIPSLPKSPSFLDPVISPKPDKGKGVVRESSHLDIASAASQIVSSAAQNDMHRSASLTSIENGNASLANSNGFSDYFGDDYASDPADTFLATPHVGAEQMQLQLSVGNGMTEKGVEEEEFISEGVLVSFSGQVWHRSCAPSSLTTK